MAVFSLADQFCNYYEYHKNPINQLIHFIFVPTLVFGFLLIFTKIPMTIPFVTEFLKPYPLIATNFGFVLMVCLVFYYLALNLQIGIIMNIEMFVFFLGANYLEQHVISAENFWYVCIAIQVVGWGIQFVGHGVFEGKRPALMDNLFQVFIAPIFVMLEYLFFLGFAKDLEKEIQKKIREREKGSTSK
eukprot:gene8746-694_t